MTHQRNPEAVQPAGHKATSLNKFRIINSDMPKRLRSAILGATGAAGLEFVRALCNHPYFEIGELYASEKNAGKPFREACTLDTSGLPEHLKNQPVRSIRHVDYSPDFFCSALPSDTAKDMEARCANYRPVISTTSAFRYNSDVPIIIAEINPEHAALLNVQKERGWNGWIAPGPNCTTVGLAMSLFPIYRSFGVERVIMSSYQAVSGGGYPLIQAWKEERAEANGLPEPVVAEGPVKNPDIRLEGNVIGYIDKEEGKVRAETKKILGVHRNGIIEPALFQVECSCVRVPTLTGHFETVFVETERYCDESDIREAYAVFNRECREKYGMLPSSPEETIVALERSPQPFFDARLYGGMATIIGRVEKCGAFDRGIKYQALSNNTEKGAAKGMVQVAEYLHTAGFL